jgi:Cu(I)/Ag(I) efflux system periplasmic protein CusF
MIRRFSHIAFASLLALGAAAFAQQPAGGDHSAHHPATPAPATQAQSPASDLAEGEVRRIDKSAGKVTLRHGEIKSLDMPPMTMVFTVTDPALLENLRQGDKVKFRAVHEGGQYRVTALEPAN